MLIIIDTNNNVKIRAYPRGDIDAQNHALQALIDPECRIYTVVAVPVLRDYNAIMLVDDEGWFKTGYRNNRIATKLCGSVIFGDALLVKVAEIDGEQSFTGFDTGEIHEISRLLREQ